MSPAPAPARPGPRPRVIVADDSPEHRWLVHQSLESLGFAVDDAADGRELFWALERHQRADSLETVVVIADVHMPVYGGLDVLEAWRCEDWPHVFVVMTGFPDDSVARRARALGAAVLSKPFRASELSRLVLRLTHS